MQREDNGNSVDIGTLGEQLVEQEKRLAEQVRIEDGLLVLNVAYEYEIPLSRMDTPEKLLHWVWHLCEKTWMTPELIRRFIQIVCSANKIEMQDS